MCQMTAVEVHRAWERYVEMRLIAGLSHDPRHFIAAQNIKGVKHISYGLATYVVCDGNRYFDFRRAPCSGRSTGRRRRPGSRQTKGSLTPCRAKLTQEGGRGSLVFGGAH